MQSFTHTFLKIALAALCVVSVFTFSISTTNPSHGVGIFAVSYVDASTNITPTVNPKGDALSAPNVDTTPISWTDSAFWTSGAFLIYITGMLLGFAGWALNGSIHYFVIDMGTFLGSDSALGKSIISSWGIIRDIINLTFVFGMIYLAFMTIVKADTSKLKHGVIQIIIAALLINFSLFFAKAIIDFGNVAAVEVYSYMQAVGHPGIVSQDDWASYGISGYFMDQLGLTEFFHPGSVISKGGSPTLAFGKDTGFGFSLLVSLTLLIATFVFFAGAILIAIRFVTLAMLLVLSPVAFAGAALPGINTEEWSSKWWKSLVSNVLFAPAYFLLLFVSMKAVNLNSLSQGLNSASPGNIVGFFKGEGDAGSILAFMNFILVIGFLVGSLIISKRMGAYGASTVNAWGTSARLYGQRALGSAVGSATFGLGAVAGRRTFGQWGVNASDDKKLQEQASGKGFRAFYANRKLSAARGLAGASFDGRQVGGLGKNLGIGEGKTGGQKKILEDVANRDKAFAESLGTVDDKDPTVVAYTKSQEYEEHHLQDMKEAQKEKVDDLNEQIKIQRIKASDEKSSLAARVTAEAEANKLTKERGLLQKEHKIVNEEQEKKIKSIKEKIEREKNRRQVGATVKENEKNQAYRDLAKSISDNKETIATASNQFTKTGSRDALDAIAKAQEEIKKAEVAQEAIISNTRGNDVGYAGVIDSYAKSKLWSWATGRTRTMNKAAAKAIRDTKTKAKKDEKKPKKDDHGGGEKKDDGHGGGDAHASH